MYYTIPILYLNMGGEMLYILQQRLHAERISSDKTIQVMNEVIHAFLDSKQLKKIFDKNSLVNFSSIRTMLKQVVLSSIIKLDTNSMNKLFDLMIMMVKFQMDTVTGPREIILLTMNHMDAVRHMTIDKTLNVYIDLVHQLIVDTFGHMSHKEIWQIRHDCLQEIKDYSLRVSILLKLGMQNQDTTFNRLVQRYNENYQERKEILDNIKLLEYSDDENSIGSLSLVGDRVTLLGKNLYSNIFDQIQNNSFTKNSNQVVAMKNKVLKQEIETLATQLGKEETTSNYLSLHLFTYDIKNIKCDPEKLNFINTSSEISTEKEISNDKTGSINEYKNNLIDNINSDFSDSVGTCIEPMDLMNLLDVM